MAPKAGSRPGRAVFRPGPPAPKRTLRSEAGSAIVEFALILPLLVMLVFGIAEFGRAFNANIQLTHATREGVRELAITGDQAGAVQVTRSAASNLDLDLLQVNTTPCEPGEMTRVRAQYPFDYNIPLFGSATLTLESEAVMRCGG